MTVIHHINAGTLHAPPHPRASCHCLLIEGKEGLVLVDTGIGLQDIARPEVRLGRGLIEQAGFQLNPEQSAASRVEQLGFRTSDVAHILLTHGDPDHAGGLSDFPQAQVHLAAEELARIDAGDPRYCREQFSPAPRWVPHQASSQLWFGREAREVEAGVGPLFLIPLFGHTRGHCGVAIAVGDRWLLHVGDAYYLRVELASDDHPVSALAASRAEDDPARRESLAFLQRLHQANSEQVDMIGYHDFTEFPEVSLAGL